MEMDLGGIAHIGEEGLESVWACLPVEIPKPYVEPSGWFRGNVLIPLSFFSCVFERLSLQRARGWAHCQLNY